MVIRPKVLALKAILGYTDGFLFPESDELHDEVARHFGERRSEATAQSKTHHLGFGSLRCFQDPWLPVLWRVLAIPFRCRQVPSRHPR